MIIAIPPEDISRVWDQVGPMLQLALDKGNGIYELPDVKKELESGDNILLAAVKDKEIQAVFTLTTLEYPRKKVLSIFLVGGSGMEEWEEEIMDTIHAIAKKQGADSVFSNGRDGWTRKMKKYGYHKVCTILERAVL